MPQNIEIMEDSQHLGILKPDGSPVVWFPKDQVPAPFLNNIRNSPYYTNKPIPAERLEGGEIGGLDTLQEILLQTKPPSDLPEPRRDETQYQEIQQPSEPIYSMPKEPPRKPTLTETLPIPGSLATKTTMPGEIRGARGLEVVPETKPFKYQPTTSDKQIWEDEDKFSIYTPDQGWQTIMKQDVSPKTTDLLRLSKHYMGAGTATKSAFSEYTEPQYQAIKSVLPIEAGQEVERLTPQERRPPGYEEPTDFQPLSIEGDITDPMSDTQENNPLAHQIKLNKLAETRRPLDYYEVSAEVQYLTQQHEQILGFLRTVKQSMEVDTENEQQLLNLGLQTMDIEKEVMKRLKQRQEQLQQFSPQEKEDALYYHQIKPGSQPLTIDEMWEKTN